MRPQHRQGLFENTARAIAGVPDEIVARHVENCTRCHPDYGAGVTAAIAALG
jgi:catalase